MLAVFSVSACQLSFFTYYIAVIHFALEAAFERQSFMLVLNSLRTKVAPTTDYQLLSARGLKLVCVVIKGDVSAGL